MGSSREQQGVEKSDQEHDSSPRRPGRRGVRARRRHRRRRLRRPQRRLVRVDHATSIKVTFKDGKTATAKLVGKDDSTDTAVIKVDAASSELHPLAIGSSAAVQPGDEVVAIGSPFGLTETMTAGIVSAVDRT